MKHVGNHQLLLAQKMLTLPYREKTLWRRPHAAAPHLISHDIECILTRSQLMWWRNCHITLMYSSLRRYFAFKQVFQCSNAMAREEWAEMHPAQSSLRTHDYFWEIRLG